MRLVFFSEKEQDIHIAILMARPIMDKEKLFFLNGMIKAAVLYPSIKKYNIKYAKMFMKVQSALK
jgi:hypothetical protein